MTPAPVALTVHPGGSLPPGWRTSLIVDWLTANHIRPDDVSADHPITILTVPHRTAEDDSDGPWLVQVICFTEYYRNPSGARELNLLTRQPVAVERTVPLSVPFPTDPVTDGEDHGQTDQQAAEEAPEEQFRPARTAPLPHRHQGASQECTVPGSAERIEGNPKDHPRQGHQAVSEPEEGWREEEVGHL